MKKNLKKLKTHILNKNTYLYAKQISLMWSRSEKRENKRVMQISTYNSGPNRVI